MVPTDIFIYGASGHGKVVADIIQSCGYKMGGWIDDREIENIYSWEAFCSTHPSAHIALGIGDNTSRAKIYHKISKAGYHLPVLIHPSAVVSASAMLKEGTVIMPLAVVNAETHIGYGCIINSGSIVEHDCDIQDFVHISPNTALAGNVHIGHHTHIGIGSSIIQNITIGSNSIIGAGSVVIDNLPDNCTAVGIPASVKNSKS